MCPVGRRLDDVCRGENHVVRAGLAGHAELEHATSALAAELQDMQRTRRQGNRLRRPRLPALIVNRLRHEGHIEREIGFAAADHGVEIVRIGDGRAVLKDRKIRDRAADIARCGLEFELRANKLRVAVEHGEVHDRQQIFRAEHNCGRCVECAELVAAAEGEIREHT